MFNRVIMIGNLTRDIELRYLTNGSAVAKGAIATSYKYKTATGEQKDEVCFLDFNIFGRSAEVANQYLKKGSKVLLEGRLVLEQWTAQDGSTRSKHSLRVESMKMMDSKGSSSPVDSEYSEMEAPMQPQRVAPQMQNSYNSEPSNYAPSRGGVEKIPEIDINDDEVPF